MHIPSCSHFLWHASEHEARPHAAQMAAFLPNGFPHIHFRSLKSTFTSRPKLKSLSTPIPSSLLIDTCVKIGSTWNITLKGNVLFRANMALICIAGVAKVFGVGNGMGSWWILRSVNCAEFMLFDSLRCSQKRT